MDANAPRYYPTLIPTNRRKKKRLNRRGGTQIKEKQQKKKNGKNSKGIVSAPVLPVLLKPQRSKQIPGPSTAKIERKRKEKKPSVYNFETFDATKLKIKGESRWYK